MKTARSIEAGYALLVGQIRVAIGSNREPFLSLEVWCPHCRRQHIHGWGEAPYPLGGVEHRVAHCVSLAVSPYESKGYYIGLDPATVPAHKATIATFKEAHERWAEWKTKRDEKAISSATVAG